MKYQKNSYFHSFALDLVITIRRPRFQKGLNPLLVEIELLVEYSTVFKTTHFDTNFMSLAYSVPELWSSAISGKFRIFEQNGCFVSKNNVNLIIFSWKIIGGNVVFKTRLKESIFGFIFILKLEDF